MDPIRTRRRVLGAIAAVLAALVAYRLMEPVPGSTTGITALLATTVLMLGVVRMALRIDPHQRDLEQKKSYHLTYRSVLATTAVTGFVMLAGLVFAGAVLGIVMAAAGYESVSYAILSNVLQRLATLMQLPVTELAALYGGSVLAAGSGFWLLYPFLPGENEERLGPAIFVLTWLVAGATALILLPATAPEPAMLALDAAVVALWGHFFAIAYEDVQAYVP